MTWRSKRQKEIPIEEAFEQAFRETKEQWLGQKPLFVVFAHGGRGHFQFLKPEMASKTWMLVFVDPMDYSGQRLLHAIDEYHRRFSICGMNFVLVLCPRYKQLFAGVDGVRAINQQILRRFHIGFPVTIDTKLLLSTIFRANYPHISVVSEGKMKFQMSGDKIFANLEPELQAYIRTYDPGVPFPKAFEAGKGHPIASDFSTLELGRGHPAAMTAHYVGEVQFEEGGPGDFLVGHFSQVKGAVRLPGQKPQEVLLQGKWLQDGERLVTADPHASLTVEAGGTHMALIGHSIPKSRSSDKDAAEMVTSDVFIELNGQNPIESQIGEGASLRFDGRAMVKVGRAGFYPLLSELPEGRRTITLKFDSADEVPIAIYGLRFGIRR